jgi:hypothetical protein
LGQHTATQQDSNFLGSNAGVSALRDQTSLQPARQLILVVRHPRQRPRAASSIIDYRSRLSLTTASIMIQ